MQKTTTRLVFGGLFALCLLLAGTSLHYRHRAHVEHFHRDMAELRVSTLTISHTTCLDDKAALEAGLQRIQQTNAHFADIYRRAGVQR